MSCFLFVIEAIRHQFVLSYNPCTFDVLRRSKAITRYCIRLPVGYRRFAYVVWRWRWARSVRLSATRWRAPPSPSANFTRRTFISGGVTATAANLYLFAAAFLSKDCLNDIIQEGDHARRPTGARPFRAFPEAIIFTFRCLLINDSFRWSFFCPLWPSFLGAPSPAHRGRGAGGAGGEDS